jgi:hypothetical protein
MNRALLALALIALASSLAAAEVVISGPGYTMTLGDNAVWQSLQTAKGREVCAAEPAQAIGAVTVDGKSSPLDTAKLEGTRLTLGCSKSSTQLVYEVTPTAEWVLFKLVQITGPRPSHMMMFQVPVSLSEHVGPRLNAAYDDQTAVCLLAANRQPDCSAARTKTSPLLRAMNQDAPGPKLEGAAVALIVCPTPKLKPTLQKASHEFGILTNEDAEGTPVKDTDMRRGSYWFINAGEQDVDQLIDYCRQSGFKQIMLNSGSWCSKVGHYTMPESRFPRGEESLKAFVDKLHAAGIKVGMHCFASKVSKTDAYVTPVPDRRFWTDMRSALPAEINATQTEIPGNDLSQWPGSPVCRQKYWEGGIDKHREVIVDDEIIQYESIGPEGKWDTFLGCKRGAWGTKTTAHTAKTEMRHYGVDGCINGYIIDQETSLLDETTTRLAGIFNRCGFDMIYFDGGEDVDRTRFNYYVSNFQETVMRKLSKRPIIHMGTIMTHRLWHSFARSSTVDVYLATLHGAIQAGYKIDKWPSVRDHINKSVDYMISVGNDLMPGELGWFGIWPRQQNTDGLQLDEIEYLMCKSLGYDVPISLETTFTQMESHPLTPGVLEIVRAYEELRMKKAVDEATRAPLREKGRDFALINDGKQRSFVPVEPVPTVAGGNALRAEAGAYGNGSVATLWHWVREAEVVIPLPTAKVRVTDLSGNTIKCASDDGNLKLSVGGKRLALITSLPVEQLRQALQEAKATEKPATRVWIKAASTTKLVGEMSLAAEKARTEPGPFGIFIVCTGQPSYDEPQEWYAEYTVQIPHPGNWTLWSHVMYPGGGDQSFGLWLPQEPISLSGDKAIGNCGLNEGKWHWTGRGGGSTTAPPGAPIRLKLPKGPFTFRVLAREGAGNANANPRLDLMVLTDDATEEMTDEVARAAGMGREVKS